MPAFCSAETAALPYGACAGLAMAIFCTRPSSKTFQPCFARSSAVVAGVQITIRPSAYSTIVPGSAKPAVSNLFGYSISAEKKRSNGAPLLIWAKKLPLELLVTSIFVPVLSPNSLDSSGITNFKSAAAAIRNFCSCACPFVVASSSTARITKQAGNLRGLALTLVIVGRLHSENHHFRRLDERSRTISRLQTKLFRRVSGNDRGDVLFANGQGHLSEQPTKLEADNTANQLISPADLAEMQAPRRKISAFKLLWNQAVDFTL